MILAVDIGNSAVTFGVYGKQDTDIKKVFRLKTQAEKTEDEYEIDMKNVLTMNNIDIGSVKAVVLCSVVPAVTETIKNVITRVWGKPPFIVSTELAEKLGVNISLDKKILGDDIFVGCVLAAKKFDLPVVVFDIGTAMSACVVDKTKTIIGGIIFPGPRLSLESLSEKCALIPSLSFESTQTIFGKTTEEAINAGISLGYASLVDGLFERMEKQIATKCSAVITGGFAKKIVPECNIDIECYDNLLLDGLVYIYETLNYGDSRFS